MSVQSSPASPSLTGIRPENPAGSPLTGPGRDAFCGNTAELILELEAIGGSRQPANQITRSSAEVLARHAGAVGAWLAVVSPGTSPESPAQVACKPLLDHQENPLWPLLGKSILDLANEVIREPGPRHHLTSEGPRLTALPLHRPEHPPEVLLVAFPSQVPAGTASSATSLAGAAIRQWRASRLLEVVSEHAQTAHRMLGLCRSVATSGSLQEGSMGITNQLAAITNASQVCLLTATTGSNPRLASVSGVDRFESSSPMATVLLEAAAESIRSGCKSALWVRSQPLEDLPALEKYAGMVACEAVATVVVPLPETGHAVFLMAFAHEPSDRAAHLQRLERLGELAAGQWTLLDRAVAPAWKNFLSSTRQLLRQNAGRTALAVLGAIALLLLCPWYYRVGAEARLEPVSRRFLTAPFDARLERTLAKNGDSVRAGDVVAVLDGSQLRMEQSALEAELAASRKRHDSSLATGDIAAAQVARNESMGTRARLDLIEEQLAQLEIRAPIDGIVVSGDLDTAEGTALKTGQTLFEIGPLDRIRAEVLIPESELRHVAGSSAVAIRLAAWPFDEWSGTITKIHQRSEIIDDRNCFVAEVELDNADGRLRPGMKGQSGVQSGWSTLGWIWLHRAWERSRHYLVW